MWAGSCGWQFAFEGLVLGWGLGFGVWGLGFGVWGLALGVWGLGFVKLHLTLEAKRSRESGTEEDQVTAQSCYIFALIEWNEVVCVPFFKGVALADLAQACSLWGGRV